DADARDAACACPRSDRTGARRATARRRRRESRPLGAAPVLGTPKHAGRRHARVEPARWGAGAPRPPTHHQRKETVMADVKQHGSGKVESGPRVPPPISGGADDAVIVRLDRSSYAATPDQALWTAIRYATNQISYNNYERTIDVALCRDPKSKYEPPFLTAVKAACRSRGPLFPGVEPYRLPKVATEVFLTLYCGVEVDQSGGQQDLPERPHHGDGFPSKLTDPVQKDRFADGEEPRYYRTLTAEEIFRNWQLYAQEIPTRRRDDPTDYTIPYLTIVRRKLGDVRVLDGDLDDGQRKAPELCYGIIREKLTRPCFLELMWSYWHEEGMLVQSLNAISQRFQNVRGTSSALNQIETSPLRPLANLLWGYIQDEPF